MEAENIHEYFAWGFRNVWGMEFHDGHLFAAAVGERLFETVNLVENGGNYGWNVREGTSCFNPEDSESPLDKCPTETLENVRGGESLLDPVIEYPQTFEDDLIGSGIVGGHFAENDSVPELQGDYVFGDYSELEDFLGDVIMAGEEIPRGSLFAARSPDEIETPTPV